MKLKIKGLKKEMSTTGTGASFAAGVGAQYATPKAFKKRKEEIGEPFTKPNPSVPNRKSKFIDYKQIFEDAMEELKFNPITDFTDSQAWAGDNTGYDMDTQDAASVLELAKVSKGGQFKVGDIQKSKGVKYTVTDIDKVTGQISWKIDYVPAFDSVFKKFDALKDAMVELDRKTNDSTIDTISDRMKGLFNQYRTYIRKNYPEEYSKFQTAENIDPKSQAKHKGKSAPFGSAYEPVKEGLINEQADYKYLTQVILDANPKMNVYYSSSRNVVNIGGVGYDSGELVRNFNQPPGSSTKIKNNFYYANENPIDTKQEVERLSNGKIKVDIQKGYGGKPVVVYSIAKSLNERLGVSKDKLNNIVKFVGAINFTQMIISLRDENVQDEIVSAFEDQYPAVMDKRDDLQEARYSQFKTETKLRTPTEQIHRAVREIRRKIDEIVKVVGHTERMKSELKGSNEGMSYLKRTRNAINTISEKLQELNNRIKGLTE